MERIIWYIHGEDNMVYSWRGYYGIFMERIIWYIHGEDNMVYLWRG
jgi:hypothetical protein